MEDRGVEKEEADGVSLTASVARSSDRPRLVQASTSFHHNFLLQTPSIERVQLEKVKQNKQPKLGQNSVLFSPSI